MFGECLITYLIKVVLPEPQSPTRQILMVRSTAGLVLAPREKKLRLLSMSAAGDGMALARREVMALPCSLALESRRRTLSESRLRFDWVSPVSELSCFAQVSSPWSILCKPEWAGYTYDAALGSGQVLDCLIGRRLLGGLGLHNSRQM